MSDKTLPLHIDPVKHADQEVTLEGVVELANLPRVSEMVLDSSGVVRAKLVFGRDEQGARVLRGELDCVLSLPCERCMGAVNQPVRSEFELGVVFTDEQAKNLPRKYEPLLVSEEMLVAELLDEELLLSLPMYVYHDANECQIDPEYQQEGSAQKTDEKDGKENPFSVLSSLKFKK